MSKEENGNGRWYARLSAVAIIGLSGWCLKEVYANAKQIAVQEAKVENLSSDIGEIKTDVDIIQKDIGAIRLMLWRDKKGRRD